MKRAEEAPSRGADVKWWAVIVGEFDGNTGNDVLVGPFRSEEKAYEARDRIERRQKRSGQTPSADVVPLVGWKEALDG